MRAWAKKSFTYGDIDLESGECFELIGARNDQKLVGLGYCEEVKRKTEVIDCTCGKSFVGEANYNAHLRGDKHPKEAVVLSS